MIDRPYVVCSCAMSLDGYIDDASEQRLILSGPADLDRVDEQRAGSDAILVGAETVRRDNPRLLVRSVARQKRRAGAGLSAQPAKVTLTSSGELDPTGNFFTAGDSQRLIYATGAALPRLAGVAATVIDSGARLHLEWLLDDLAGRGIRRLLVEGGSRIHTAFLGAGLVDELQLVVAPLFVGDPTAPQFVTGGQFPAGRLRLAEVRRLDDVVLLRYLTGERDG